MTDTHILAEIARTPIYAIWFEHPNGQWEIVFDLFLEKDDALKEAAFYESEAWVNSTVVHRYVHVSVESE